MQLEKNIRHIFSELMRQDITRAGYHVDTVVDEYYKYDYSLSLTHCILPLCACGYGIQGHVGDEFGIV